MTLPDRHFSCKVFLLKFFAWWQTCWFFFVKKIASHWVHGWWDFFFYISLRTAYYKFVEKKNKQLGAILNTVMMSFHINSISSTREDIVRPNVIFIEVFLVTILIYILIGGIFSVLLVAGAFKVREREQIYTNKNEWFQMYFLFLCFHFIFMKSFYSVCSIMAWKNVSLPSSGRTD